MERKSKLDEKLEKDHPEYWKEEKKKRHMEFSETTGQLENQMKSVRWILDHSGLDDTTIACIILKLFGGFSLRDIKGIGKQLYKCPATISKYMAEGYEKARENLLNSLNTYESSRKEAGSKVSEDLVQLIHEEEVWKSRGVMDIPGFQRYTNFKHGEEMEELERAEKKAKYISDKAYKILNLGIKLEGRVKFRLFVINDRIKKILDFHGIMDKYEDIRVIKNHRLNANSLFLIEHYKLNHTREIDYNIERMFAAEVYSNIALRLNPELLREYKTLIDPIPFMTTEKWIFYKPPEPDPQKKHTITSKIIKEGIQLWAEDGKKFLSIHNTWDNKYYETMEENNVDKKEKS